MICSVYYLTTSVAIFEKSEKYLLHSAIYWWYNYSKVKVPGEFIKLFFSQMLDGTQNQTREETHSLTEVVEKEFDKLLASLDSR